jgi:alcohol dehydrogenase
VSSEVTDAEHAARLIGFDLRPQTRVVFGIGVIDRLGELTRELGARRVLVVTDPGIAAAGHLDNARWALGNHDLETVVYDQVHENPTTRDVDACLAVAREAGIDSLIGLGGGSSIDTARGTNFLLTNGGRMQDYWGVGKATKQMLPMIAVPTTAGTGSECQSFALIADEHTHQKMACGDPKAAARVALLDPTLTLSQPRGVTACTGIDALAHALETAVTVKRNAISQLYSREAFRMVSGSFARVLSDPDDLQARARMQLGAAYAGMAIENSMLGAAHAAANPLTAHFDVVHGEAVGLMLPHVIRFNAEQPGIGDLYLRLAIEGGLVPREADLAAAIEALTALVTDLMRAAELPTTLSARGVTADALPMLAAEAARQWTARMNPREIGEAGFSALYAGALG